jgi:hypothetical protein
MSSRFDDSKAENENELLMLYKQPAHRRIQAIMPIPAELLEPPWQPKSGNTPKTPVMQQMLTILPQFLARNIPPKVFESHGKPLKAASCHIAK